MATTISTQDIVDAKRDIDDIGKAVNEKVIVSPRYGEDFKSLPMITEEFQDAIETAAAAAAGANGWTDLLIQTADGSTQRAKNASFQTQINSKADTTYVDTQDASLQSQIDQKASAAYLDAALDEQTQTVNTALSQLSTQASKFYPTLAEANADIANIEVNQPVQIGESGENGGLWYKATAEATTLTKSAYDPLTQAKADATTKANTAKNEAIEAANAYTNGYVIEVDGNAFEFLSQDGFKFAEISPNKIDLSNAAIQSTMGGGFAVVSNDGFDLLGNTNTSESEDSLTVISTKQPLFTDLIVGFDGDDININVECLIAQRALQRKQRTVIAAIAPNGSNYFKQSSEILSIQANKINGSAKLYLRDINSYNYTSLDVAVKSVAKSGLSGSPKILMVGDSITNRGGAAIVDTVLRGAGLTPSFIGTITGAGTNEAALGTGGKLNEGREGWRTTQFTNALADKTPVTVGDEAAYLALSKNDKIKWNPFIREAVGGDDPSIVKNGYVLDFEFYRNRFSLDAPDIVVLQLGTNDIVYAPATSEQNVYDNILLIMQRLRVAFPSCKIIVSSVGRAISTETTDAQYDSLYPPVFRSTQKAIKDSGLSNVYFCPSFATADTFTGFPVTATETDAISGAITGAYSDGLHPTYSGRQTLYTSIAAYIAAAVTNVI